MHKTTNPESRLDISKRNTTNPENSGSDKRNRA
jgi:hypothetical protein